jgi:hypothetical protein
MCPNPSMGCRQDYNTLWRGRLVIGHDLDRPARCRIWVTSLPRIAAAVPPFTLKADVASVAVMDPPVELLVNRPRGLFRCIDDDSAPSRTYAPSRFGAQAVSSYQGVLICERPARCKRFFEED